MLAILGSGCLWQDTASVETDDTSDSPPGGALRSEWTLHDPTGMALDNLLEQRSCALPRLDDDTDAQPNADPFEYDGPVMPSNLELGLEQLIAIGLVRSSTTLCTGTLIAHWWVLTAKHCVEVDAAGSYIVDVYLGEDPAYPSHRFESRQIVVHDEVDLALIELQVPRAALPAVAPISLPHAGDPLAAGPAEAAGYGVTPSGEAGTRLFVPETLVDWSDGEIVADAGPHEGLCEGDSGGPLLLLDDEGWPRLVGVLSRGGSDCVGSDIFVRADAHLSWIEKTVGALPARCDTDDETYRCDGSRLLACRSGVEWKLDCGGCGLGCRRTPTGVVACDGS